MSLRGARALYVTYDGLLEPLGRSQVLPYVERLSARGVVWTILSYEKPEDLLDEEALRRTEERVVRFGGTWIRLPYRKRPPLVSTVRDVLDGIATIRRLGTDFDVLHARSYVPAVIARTVAARDGIPWIFDMRGFWVDERVDGGVWRRGPVFHWAKRWERRLLRDAAGIIVLTHAATEHLDRLAGTALSAPVRVIPTCVDLDRFVRPADPAALRSELGLPADATVLVYIGSFGTWYLGPETFGLAEALDRAVDDFHFVVLTREVDRARELTPPSLEGRVTIRSVGHGEVPTWLGACDLAVAFVRPSFSKTASAATKMGEYLACGLTVAATPIGDVRPVLNEGGGVVVDEVDADGLDRAAELLLDVAGQADSGAVARATAERHFSLDSGVRSLGELYEELLDGEEVE